ncbi:MAG TPA: hypothetical protein VD884_14215 [Ohtaekwangia sp.]|nr:hypothetical protein [Ohtaekwangia sp.]
MINKLLTAILLYATLISCNKDDDAGPSYNFKDQLLSGKIDNETFVHGDGFFDNDDEETVRIVLTVAQAHDLCEVIQEGNEVFFYIDKEEKLTKLGDNQTITLLKDGSPPYNIFATSGAIEITSITETSISGRIDARVDNESFVNGNFTVYSCPH